MTARVMAPAKPAKHYGIAMADARAGMAGGVPATSMIGTVGGALATARAVPVAGSTTSATPATVRRARQ
ncbi:hypothetical protein [Duganella sp. FT27W]|uniref:hypothetical protein n=1 Tax=Duganella sp. FT27W TaxID=2654636 RepID=UPI00128B0932|nr:hypothetical protein [Duganella sp. FT27W]MPQ60461.1 hypothetical protein [Duganella sp. FT27W]